MTDPMQPSTSALLYLGADDLLPTGGKFTGVRIPCRDVKVPQKDLSAMLVAAALLEHRDAGALSLDPFEKKVLFRKTTRLAVQATGATGAPGWGAALLAAAHPGDDVRDLIRRWFGRDVPNPYVQVVGHVEAELVTAGLMSAAEEESGLRGKAARMLRGKPDVEANCERIGVLAGTVALAVERWRGWAAAEPQLVPLLLEECHAGIASREQDND